MFSYKGIQKENDSCHSFLRMICTSLQPLGISACGLRHIISFLRLNRLIQRLLEFSKCYLQINLFGKGHFLSLYSTSDISDLKAAACFICKSLTEAQRTSNNYIKSQEKKGITCSLNLNMVIHTNSIAFPHL